MKKVTEIRDFLAYMSYISPIYLNIIHLAFEEGLINGDYHYKFRLHGKSPKSRTIKFLKALAKLIRNGLPL